MPRPLWRSLTILLFVACATQPARADDDSSPAASGKPSLLERFQTKLKPKKSPPADAMPLTRLSPAKITPDLCAYRYAVGTSSPLCQQHCDQAFGYYYSYVWMEAARSFETALKHDPECAQAWLGLHSALTKWGKTTSPRDLALGALGAGFSSTLPDRLGKPPADYALSTAQALMPKASHRTQLLVRAKLQERGLWPDTPADERKKRATATLDELITLYDDDEEAWFARAQLAEGSNGATPFYKALLRINPLHPGANHELVHFYENVRRPALGWPFAEGYIQSSPGIPHAFHMQAHLGTRVGKWKQTTDWSAKAVELQRAYHKAMTVGAGDDHQFFHHLEILTKSLLHDGRLAEATAVETEAKSHKYTMSVEWFRLAVMGEDWPEAQKIVEQQRKSSKFSGAYYGAQLALARHDLPRAAAELDVLRQIVPPSKGDKSQQIRLWEIQGRVMCACGQGEAGVKLLRRAVEKTKDDFNHHAWGGGAYHMEAWGLAALEAGLAADAEEAFQEALAHDAGSIRGALGLWALCTRLGRTDEAARYFKVAQRCWAKADATLFDRLRSDFSLAAEAVPVPTATSATADEGDQR